MLSINNYNFTYIHIIIVLLSQRINECNIYIYYIIYLFNTMKKNNQDYFRGINLNIFVYYLSSLCIEFEMGLLTLRYGVNSDEMKFDVYTSNR